MMGTNQSRSLTLRDLLWWCQAAPDGTRLDAQELGRLLEQVVPEGEPWPEAEAIEGSTEEAAEASWRTRLWICPPETRLGVQEVAEALARPKSFVYSRTRSDAEDPLPHRKHAGALVFVAGEVRKWIIETEEVVVAGNERRRQLLKLAK